MTRDETKALLVRVVTDKQGLKATELCCEILDDAYLSDEQRRALMRQEEFNLPDLIAELIKEEELIEVEYVVPNISYRAKSFLLPKNSKIQINKQQKITYQLIEECFKEKIKNFSAADKEKLVMEAKNILAVIDSLD